MVFFLGCTLAQVKIDQVLTGNSGFLCQILEVRNRAFIKIDGYLTLCFTVIGATLSFGKIIFFSHAIRPHVAYVQISSPFELR
jgi:hypothetical protein